jgi:uncharacterized membrane protein
VSRQADPLARIERVRNLLAMFLVGAFVGALIAFTFKGIPEANKDIITYMVGQLSGMATLALGFYFVNKVGQDAIDAAKTENSAKAFDAIKAAAQAGKSDEPDVVLEPGETAQAKPDDPEKQP